MRYINAASATICRVALAGHRMTVTHTDGQPVEPIEVDNNLYHMMAGMMRIVQVG